MLRSKLVNTQDLWVSHEMTSAYTYINCLSRFLQCGMSGNGVAQSITYHLDRAQKRDDSINHGLEKPYIL